MQFRDKVVVVTGGGNGMGRELVLGLLAKGARVAAVDINEGALAETAALAKTASEAQPRLATFTKNITDADAVRALPSEVQARFDGVVDGLINCAGIIQPFVRLKDLDDAAIERVINVNFFGTLRMTRAFLPHLLARPSSTTLANFSSMGGFRPVPGQTMYGASKAAVKLMTEGLSAELEGTNVKVSVIFPGGVATNITGNSGVTMDMSRIKVSAKTQERMTLTPKRAAELILHGLERERVRIIVGKDARMMDLLYRLNPERATRFIAKQMRFLLAS